MLPQKVQDLLTKLETQKNYINTELFTPYTSQQLNAKPTNDGWSAAQVVEHLIQSEYGTRLYLQKKLSFKPQLNTVSIATKLKFKAFLVALKSPKKFKAPTSVSNLPTHINTADQFGRWQEERIALNNYLHSLSPDLYDKEIFKHPFAGRLTIAQTLIFFLEHANQHIKQIQYTLKEVA